MKTFLISDTHFHHKNILSFKDKFGQVLRPFSTVEEMNETMINNWNKVVSSTNKVYHLGDIAMCSFSKLKEIFDRLNGTKVLIKGNHDNLKLSQYAQLFKDVRSYHQLDKFILSHIPLHPDALYRWKANIHGHTHQRNYQDLRYFNVSVENINYTPMDFELIRTSYADLQL